MKVVTKGYIVQEQIGVVREFDTLKELLRAYPAIMDYDNEFIGVSPLTNRVSFPVKNGLKLIASDILLNELLTFLGVKRAPCGGLGNDEVLARLNTLGIVSLNDSVRVYSILGEAVDQTPYLSIQVRDITDICRVLSDSYYNAASWMAEHLDGKVEPTFRIEYKPVTEGEPIKGCSGYYSGEVSSAGRMHSRIYLPKLPFALEPGTCAPVRLYKNGIVKDIPATAWGVAGKLYIPNPHLPRDEAYIELSEDNYLTLEQIATSVYPVYENQNLVGVRLILNDPA